MEGEYWLERTRSNFSNPFIFPVRATAYRGGQLKIGKTTVSVPRELVGRKLMLKVVIEKDKKKKNNTFPK